MRLLSRKRRRDLRARRWQYGAAALTIFLGVMAFATSYDAYRNLDASYKGTYDRLSFADVTVSGASDGFAADVMAQDGVAATEERLQADTPIRMRGKDVFVGRLVGMPTETQPDVNRIDVLEGSYLSAEDLDAALVEIHMFDTWELAQGDVVEYFDGAAWQTLKVGGSALSPEYIWPARSSQDVITGPKSFGVLFVAEEVVRALPDPLVIEQDLVLYAEDADRETLDERIAAIASGSGASAVVLQEDQASNKVLQLDVLGFQQMAIALPVMFLLAAGMATYTLMTRLVYQERQIIGTLRANGLTRGAVVRHYLSYGVWLGGISGALGVAIGMPLGWLSTEAYTAELGIPDTIRGFYWSTVAVGLAFGLVTGFVSAWVPARNASRLDPAVAMRGDVPVAGGGLSIFERLLPPLRRLPVRWRMVLRSIGRSRRRSFATILGVVLALILLLSTWGLFDSVKYLLDRQYQHIQLEDGVAVFDTAVTPAAVDAVADVEGVADAERAYALSVSVANEGERYATQLIGFESDTSMHGFEDGLPDAGVLLGTALRDDLSVTRGESVQLSFPGLDTSVKVEVAGFVEEPLGTFAYMASSEVERVLASADPAVTDERLQAPDASVVYVRLAEDTTDREAALEAIESVDGVVSVADSRSLLELTEQYLGLFYVFIFMMLVFGGTLAFALIFNTMSVNLAERAGEMATMRANGLSRRQAAALVLGENLLLTAIAIPPGLWLGTLAADALMASYSTDVFVFRAYIAPLTYALSALAMFVVTLLSLWPGLRVTDRLDIGTVVRQRSI